MTNAALVNASVEAELKRLRQQNRQLKKNSQKHVRKYLERRFAGSLD